MNDLDQRIRDALKTSGAGDALAREPNVAEELIGTFRTRHRWIHAIAFVFTFVLFVVALWAGYRFVEADAPREQLAWGGVCVLGMVFVGFLKVYFWLEIHTNRILRELKRVELLVLQQPKG